MKKQEGLVRQSLAGQVDPTVVEGTLRELATKSATVLGYKLVHKITTKPKTLRQALNELNIAPFSTRSVEAYKAKKVNVEIKKLGKNPEGLDVRWSKRQIQNYSDAIPESVLMKAIQIKEAYPDVRIEIEQLTVAKPDPFLVVSYEREYFYIDVWDEPAFENAILKGAYIKGEDDFDDD